MTYDANEASVQDGTPFECYEFDTPIGYYRYTTLPFSVTLNGQSFESETIDRTNFTISSVIDGLTTMDIILPFQNALALKYTQAALPDYCSVTVYRAHYGDDLSSEFNVEWRGETTGTKIKDNKFILETQSVMLSLLVGEARSVVYQYSCNNRVYDSVCGLNAASFSTSATVTRVNLNRITVNDDGNADNELVLGKITLGRTGEVRAIVSNTDVDSGGSEIEIQYPFDDIAIGDTVTLTLGCDNRRNTCVTRFNNILNFTGFPYIPTENPLQG